MGFLTTLFQSKSEKYLLSAINELKQEKDYLQSQLKDKDELIKLLTNKLIAVTPHTPNEKTFSKSDNLTPLERKILSISKSSNYTSLKELAVAVGLKYSSMKVYSSNLKRKGYGSLINQ